jgi:hypothetical protein
MEEAVVIEWPGVRVPNRDTGVKQTLAGQIVSLVYLTDETDS